MDIDCRDLDLGDSPEAALAQTLIDAGGWISQCLAHMVAWEAAGLSAPDAPPIPQVLGQLVRDVLQEAFADVPPDRLRDVAHILREGVSGAAEGMFLVAPSAVRPPRHRGTGRPPARRPRRRP